MPIKLNNFGACSGCERESNARFATPFESAPARGQRDTFKFPGHVEYTVATVIGESPCLRDPNMVCIRPVLGEASVGDLS